jgi:glycerate dehydrogenase
VFNVKDYAGTAVPQHVFALLLALSNQLCQYQQAVQRGDWSRSQNFCLLDYPMFELAGKTMVIVGYGSLGQATAELAKAFGMRVLIAERPDVTEVRPGRIAFNNALALADVLSLHCPLTPATQHLLNRERLAQLKAGAVLINTARGGLIETEALIAALKSGQLLAAALDVLETEPPPAEHPLLQCRLPNLLLTPHIGWASREARTRMVLKIAANIQNFVNSRMETRR